MDSDQQISVTLFGRAGDIDAALWDACAAPEAANGGRAQNPFLTHRFFSAFEDSESAHWREGWDPKHMLAQDADGTPLGILPLYVKGHSQGEYIFDHGWANAFHRAGGSYYPKLLSALPFTPVTARKLLIHPDAPQEMAESALITGAAQITAENQLSSLHVNFCTKEELAHFEAAGFLTRVSQQFHWQNDGYADFDGFLAQLSSRKRKAIRKERAKAVEGVEVFEFTGAEIQPEHWDAFWLFYQDTGARKWGSPYLNRAFFEIAHQTLRDDMLLVLARRDGNWVAGALNVIGRETLYGRYWGCTEEIPCLHFELCYYRAIDYAIRHGLSRVEAGAQGEHKLARGYVPAETYSAHYIPDPGFRRAVAQYLEQEGEIVAQEIAFLGEHTPFRKG